MIELVVNRVDVHATYQPPEPGRERFRAVYRWEPRSGGPLMTVGDVHTALAALAREGVPPDAQFQETYEAPYVAVYAYWSREYPDGR